MKIDLVENYIQKENVKGTEFYKKFKEAVLKYWITLLTMIQVKRCTAYFKRY